MPPLTAAELIQHPEFKNVIYDLPPTKKGKVSVASGRGGPFDIAYEVHGHGPIHIVWLMGLGSLMKAWQRQTKDFGHDRGEKYTCLIHDNRGMGESDKPFLRYSTSEMAKDVVELLDHIEWTGKRQLHIVGLSMGGMIAQELAVLIPQRIASLTLLSTAARLVNTQGFIENLRNRINLFIPRNLDRQLEMVKHNMFTPSWLLLPDGEGKFPTNGDRVAAQDLRKRMDHEAFTRKGFILQAIAAGWHHKSKEQLHELADNVGRKRILVMHGDQDRMITPPHGKVLRDELSTEQEEVQWKFVEEKGHVLPWEWRGGFTEMMEEFWGKTEGLDDHDGEEQPLAVSES